MVDEERKRGKRGKFDGNKVSCEEPFQHELTDFQTTHQGTMRYLHLYLACHLLLETRFEAAGDHLYRSKPDPRLIVRLFTRLRGKVIGSAEEIDIYDGLRSTLIDMPPIDDISE